MRCLPPDSCLVSAAWLYEVHLTRLPPSELTSGLHRGDFVAHMVVADDQVAVWDVHALLAHCGADQQLDVTSSEFLDHTLLLILGHPCKLTDIHSLPDSVGNHFENTCSQFLSTHNQ